MINFALAREIYGSSPWMVDAISFPGLFNILQDFRGGIQLDFDPKNKLNSVSLLNVNSKTRFAEHPFQLDRMDSDAEIISVIRIDGPITKNGGQSSFGMKQISRRMDAMSRDRRVKGHVLVADSGGGATNAIVWMADAIKNSQSLGKPVVQLIEKGGMSASAMFAIGSYTDFTFSESAENIVGSIGTMVELSGFPKNHTEENGMVHVRVYATESFEKNLEFEEALKGNLKPVINNMLDPINEKFLSEIMENRPNISKEHLTGKTFRAGEVIGTLVDAIGGMEDAVNKVLELSATEIKVNSSEQIKSNAKVAKTNNNNNNKKMDLEKLKSEHPAIYNKVFSLGRVAGVSAEKDRCGAWMAHSSTDIDAVKAGIESGNDITATARENFIVKGASLNQLNNLKKDSKGNVIVPESTTETQEEIDNKEAASFYDDIEGKLKK